MVIAIILIITFLIFYLPKRHLGVSILASVAGILVYNLINANFTDFILKIIPNIPRTYLEFSILIILTLFLPFLFCFHQVHTSSCLLHTIKCLCYATLLLLLLAPQLQLFLPFDQISANFLHTLTPFYQLILITNVALAYLDIFSPQKEI